MKHNIFLFCIVLAVGLSSCAQDYKKLSDSEIDKSKVRIAQEFATNYLNQSKKGMTYVFKDEATSELKNLLTPETQKNVYQSIKKQFGDFQNLEYIETYADKNVVSSGIQRFKGSFGEKDKKLEVRVVLDQTDKVAGFWIKPWSDMLK